MKTTAELAEMYFPNEDHKARAEMLAEHARRVAIEECVAWLRQPASDALNRAADDIRRDLDPLQKRVAFLLDGIADEIAAFLQQNVRDLTPARLKGKGEPAPACPQCGVNPLYRGHCGVCGYTDPTLAPSASMLDAFVARAVAAERKRCERIAREGCLVPPDGGSPTEAETEMCERIAAAIRRGEP